MDGHGRISNTEVYIFQTLTRWIRIKQIYRSNFLNQKFIYSIIPWCVLMLYFRCCKCPGYGHRCTNHCPNKCSDRKIFHGRILYLEGTLIDARANVSCDGGFHISGQSTCTKTSTIKCVKSEYGSLWISHNSSTIPKCERMGKYFGNSLYFLSFYWTVYKWPKV